MKYSLIFINLFLILKINVICLILQDHICPSPTSWIYFKLSLQMESLLKTHRWNYFATLPVSRSELQYHTCSWLPILPKRRFTSVLNKKNSHQFASIVMDMRQNAEGWSLLQEQNNATACSVVMVDLLEHCITPCDDTHFENARSRHHGSSLW